jgi:heparanase
VRVMRQQLCCGSVYDLLRDRGNNPNPDFWATLLWRRLMSGRVLSIKGDMEPGRSLRSYAHCAVGRAGAVAVALINMRDEAATVNFASNASGTASGDPAALREVYLLATTDGLFTGHEATLNGHELRVEGSELPRLTPEQGKGPVVMPPRTVAFVVYPEARAHGCR